MKKIPFSYSTYPNVYRRARRKAARTNSSIGKVIHEYLEQYVEDEQEVPEDRDPIEYASLQARSKAEKADKVTEQTGIKPGVDAGATVLAKNVVLDKPIPVVSENREPSVVATDLGGDSVLKPSGGKEEASATGTNASRKKVSQPVNAAPDRKRTAPVEKGKKVKRAGSIKAISGKAKPAKGKLAKGKPTKRQPIARKANKHG